MTISTRLTAKTIITIWPIQSKDEFGQVVYGDPYTVKATYEQGSSRQYRDAQGVAYIPASIYWYEDIGIYPSLNDKIVVGNFTDEENPVNVSGTEAIKNRIRQEDAVLGGTPDIMVMT